MNLFSLFVRRTLTLPTQTEIQTLPAAPVYPTWCASVDTTSRPGAMPLDWSPQRGNTWPRNGWFLSYRLTS